MIDQDLTTGSACRYRQAIPPGFGGRLDIDSNYGIRRDFLPQGERHYSPLKQPTAQEVMLETLSSSPIIVMLIGAHTNNISHDTSSFKEECGAHLYNGWWY